MPVDGRPSPGTPGLPPSAGQVSLAIAVSTNMSPPTHYMLRCAPDSGTLPDPVAVCSRLLAAPDLFGPLPTHRICAAGMIGTGRVVLSGTYLGRPVDETIADSGCDLQRWTEIKYVLGLPRL